MAFVTFRDLFRLFSGGLQALFCPQEPPEAPSEGIGGVPLSKLRFRRQVWVAMPPTRSRQRGKGAPLRPFQ